DKLGDGGGCSSCPCPGLSGVPRKRRRTTFSRGQLSELERAFAAIPYPDIATRERLAELTQLPEAKIQ
ncbi:SEBOX protein, partial [Geococcyx californianus]|nr:SEBOX protein [Geococcyx californianus]